MEQNLQDRQIIWKTKEPVRPSPFSNPSLTPNMQCFFKPYCIMQGDFFRIAKNIPNLKVSWVKIMMHKTNIFFRVLVICELMFERENVVVVEVWSSGRTSDFNGNAEDLKKTEVGALHHCVRKVESSLLKVTNHELSFYFKALKVTTDKLFGKINVKSFC
jgi:hypothetical protein